MLTPPYTHAAIDEAVSRRLQQDYDPIALSVEIHAQLLYLYRLRDAIRVETVVLLEGHGEVVECDGCQVAVQVDPAEWDMNCNPHDNLPPLESELRKSVQVRLPSK